MKEWAAVEAATDDDDRPRESKAETRQRMKKWAAVEQPATDERVVVEARTARSRRQGLVPVWQVLLLFAAGAVAGVLLQQLLGLNRQQDGNGLEEPARRLEFFEPKTHCGMLCELSAEEMRSVAEYFTVATGTLSKRDLATPWSPWLAGPSAIELLAPGKQTVLGVLDRGERQPPRYARVTVADPTRDGVVEYAVGPVDSPREIREIGVKAPFSKRPTEPGSDAEAARALLDATVQEMGAEVLETLCGPIFPALEGYQESRGEASPSMQNDALSPPGERYDLYGYMWTPPSTVTELQSFWLHPVPFAARVNSTNVDPTLWNVVDVALCGQTFESATAARRAYFAGAVRCRFFNTTGNLPWEVPSIKDRPLKQRPPALGRGLRWGPWSMVVSGSRPSQGGPALFDIKFNNERVLFELSLQDAMAAYSGSPKSEFFYSDASWSLSQFSASLEPGIDCPKNAYYFSSPIFYTLLEGGDAISDPTKATEYHPTCAFEWTEDHSIWRHMENSAPPKVSGLARRTLVVRSVATVGNYDYYASIAFREDGEIEVNAKFAGYIESRHFDANSNPDEIKYSTLLRPDLAGPVHSHLIVFKADFDIGGNTRNALQITKSVVDPDTQSKALQRTTVEFEGVNESTFVADPSEPSIWAVVDRRASVGPNPRGYSVSLSSFATVQGLPPTHPFTRAMSYSKYHLAVTKHKDHEYRITSPYVQYDANNLDWTPALDLDTFLDDRDSLLDQDLVCWISTGREHITRQEDLPLVSNFGTHFSLQPFNFFPHNVAASGALT